jgi:hypothetical protein
MSLTTRALRPLWLPNLKDVDVPGDAGLANWLIEQEYQISKPPTNSSFVLEIAAETPLLMAIAADINRLASASFETISQPPRHPRLPRSTGWNVIQTYYAAYFAAHALLRIFGMNCSRLSAIETSSVLKLAKQVGLTVPINIKSGTYLCKLDGALLSCKLKEDSEGVHEALWSAFSQLLSELSKHVLSVTTETSADRLTVSGVLTEVVAGLSQEGFSNGSWLSKLRNRVNYRQQLKVWHPYGENKRFYDRIHDRNSIWTSDVDKILPLNEASVSSFQVLSHWIVAVCREIVEEMSEAANKSYLDVGAARVLRLVT